MEQSRDIYIDVCDIHTHVHIAGNEGGMPLILMHGWGCNVSTVASIESVCAANGCRVYNIDLPGFGQSSEPPTIWGIEEYTHHIEALTKELGIIRPILLGHSFGGRISILMSSRNDVRAVILVDAAGIRPRHSLKYYLKVYSYKFGQRMAYALLPHTKAEAVVERMRRSRGSSDYANSTPMMRSILSRCVGEDLRHVMPSIKAPTLLIWGENDTATPIRDAHIMEKSIADAGLVSFAGCGHYSFLDNPIGFRAVVASFLNSLKDKKQ